MTDMIERVASVLCARCGVDPSDMAGGLYDGGSYARGEPAWAAWADDARAAIAAMRESTDDQMRAGAKALAMEMQAPSATLMGIGYAAMIDAALKAPGTE